MVTIKIYTVGGTIDKVYFDRRSHYEVGPPNIASVLEEVNVGFDYEIESLLRKDSLDMTAEDRRIIVEKVRVDAAGRFVITHGTDTMIETAKALRSITGKTIVLTGAMTPALFQRSDAAFNIGCAITAAQTLDAGVYVAMNGRIFDPDRVVKNVEDGQFEDA